jgi:hypothetical protein
MKEFLNELSIELAASIGCCENCGIHINQASGKNVAHILPKRIFKSVALEPRNVMFLCTNFDRNDGKTGCHEKFDSSWSTAQKMEVWEIAKNRVAEIRELVSEQSKILWYFE